MDETCLAAGSRINGTINYPLGRQRGSPCTNSNRAPYAAIIRGFSGVIDVQLYRRLRFVGEIAAPIAALGSGARWVWACETVHKLQDETL